MFASLRAKPERWLLTAFIAVLLAPVVAQGLDRPLASLFGSRPSGALVTAAALVVALAGSLATAERDNQGPAAALAVAGLVAIAFGLAFGMHPPAFVALVAAGGGAVFLSRWLAPRLPPAVDGIASRSRALTIGYGFVALLSVVQVARVSVFMADPTRTETQVVPGVAFLETHSCLTAYVRADELARDGAENLYLAERWPQTVGATVRPETPFSPFDIDAYFYPPPFLLLAEVLAPLRGDFLAQRAAWFGINGILLAIGFWVAAKQLGGPRWHRPLLIAPLFFASLPALVLLQVGNVQAAVVVGSVLAMLAFERERQALGGFALALMTLSKIAPGILGVILIMQKRFRSVAWTAAFAVILLLATLVAFGSDPIASWLFYALPRVSSGEAFSDVLHHTESIALNMSPGGTPFKLALLGVDVGDPWPVMRLVNQVVTVIVVVLAIVIGRRSAKPTSGPLTQRALAWMALLFLTALRSPFAPGYVVFSFAWATTFLSVEVERKREGVLLVAVFGLVTSLPPLPTEGLIVYGSIMQLVAIGVALWLILRRESPSGSALGRAAQTA